MSHLVYREYTSHINRISRVIVFEKHIPTVLDSMGRLIMMRLRIGPRVYMILLSRPHVFHEQFLVLAVL